MLSSGFQFLQGTILASRRQPGRGPVVAGTGVLLALPAPFRALRTAHADPQPAVVCPDRCGKLRRLRQHVAKHYAVLVNERHVRTSMGTARQPLPVETSMYGFSGEASGGQGGRTTSLAAGESIVAERTISDAQFQAIAPPLAVR